MDIEKVWNNIKSHEGETFRTVRGIEFTYVVVEDYILINDDKKRRITKDSIKTAITINQSSNFHSGTILPTLQKPSHFRNGHSKILIDHVLSHLHGQPSGTATIKETTLGRVGRSHKILAYLFKFSCFPVFHTPNHFLQIWHLYGKITTNTCYSQAIAMQVFLF